MRSVLVVDDNPQNLYFLQVLLAAHGLEVETAANGAQAIEIAQKKRPGMIISDILMPVMDGFSLCRAVKKDKDLHSIPFIFYTATYTDPKDEALALSLGADRFVIKPAEPEAFLSLLEDAWKEFEQKEKTFATPQPVQEIEYHEQYNAALIRKLESKMVELEAANRALARDIAERKRVENALRESEAKIRSIMENIGIGIAVVDPELLVLEANQRMRDWFPDIAQGKLSVCHTFFTHPADQARHMACPTCQTLGDGLTHEAVIQSTRNGIIRHYRVVATPISGAGQEIAAAIEMVEDITERLSLEAQVIQAQKMEAIGQLAGGMAHDFNNMLTVVLGHADLAAKEIDPGHPLHSRIQAILDVSFRTSAIVRQLLAFARKQAMEPESLDLNAVVEGMIKVLQRLIGENIELVWRPASDLWRVKMDPTQVEQILANLCVNARDAIAGAGRIIIESNNESFDESYCSRHAEFAPGDYAMLTVSDTGCGMDMMTLHRIFEPFFTTKEEGKGTGLGLSTVYGIVRQNHGFINVSSEPGGGAVFKIYFARHAGEQSTGTRGEEKALLLGSGETILLVEDEALVLEITHGILVELGYRVMTASTPDEAIRLASESKEKIDLLMADVILPKITGRELAGLLKEKRPGLKCVFMSGYTDDILSSQGLWDGAEAQFIAKPFSVKGLAAIIHKVLA